MTDEVARGRPVDDAVEPLTVTFQPAGRAARRQVFEPRAGDGPDWVRVEKVRAHDRTWREVGSELVETVTVTRPD